MEPSTALKTVINLIEKHTTDLEAIHQEIERQAGQDQSNELIGRFNQLLELALGVEPPPETVSDVFVHRMKSAAGPLPVELKKAA